VVQVYGRRDGRRPRLLGFARVEVPAGEATPVEIRVPRDRLAVRDVAAHRWVVEPGRYDLTVARNATDASAQHLGIDVD
jgi:beta-glucosidase